MFAHPFHSGDNTQAEPSRRAPALLAVQVPATAVPDRVAAEIASWWLVG